LEEFTYVFDTNWKNFTITFVSEVESSGSQVSTGFEVNLEINIIEWLRNEIFDSDLAEDLEESIREEAQLRHQAKQKQHSLRKKENRLEIN